MRKIKILLIMMIWTPLFAEELKTPLDSLKKIDKDYIKGWAKIDSGTNAKITNYNIDFAIHKALTEDIHLKYDMLFYFKDDNRFSGTESRLFKTGILNENYLTDYSGFYLKTSYFSDKQNDLDYEIKYGVGYFHKAPMFSYRIGVQERLLKHKLDDYSVYMLKTGIMYSDIFFNNLTVKDIFDYDVAIEDFNNKDIENKISATYMINSFFGVELTNQYYRKIINLDNEKIWNSVTMFNLVFAF